MNASHIDAVTVFREGATVTRIVQADGPGTLVIGNLPLSMDDGSIRVEASGGLSCLDARVETHTPADGEVEEIDEERVEAAQRRGRAKARVDLLTADLTRLRDISTNERPDAGEGQPPSPLAVAQARTALLDFRRDEVFRVLRELEQAGGSLRVATRELAEIDERNARASTARKARKAELRKSLRMRLEGEGKSTLQVQYTVPAASWSSTLQLRFARSLEGAELVRGALVRQRTGEDWSGVRLRLSTALPSAWTELGELLPLRIGRVQPPKPSSWRPPPTGTAELYEPYDRAFAGKKTSPAPGGLPEDTLSALIKEEAAPTPKKARRARSQRRVKAALPPPSPSPKAKTVSLGASGAAPPMEWESIADEAEEFVPRRFAAPVIVDADRFRDYGNLHLGSPDSPARGVLRPRELSSGREAIIRAALQRAGKLGRFPAGHHGVRSVDGFDHAWTVDHRVDVPSDTGVHAIALERASTAAEPRFVVVPRQSREVFRVVELRNELSSPLLPGPAEVFVDGAYLLTTTLKAVQPGETAPLGLGVEQAIEVARNATFEERSEGLLVSHVHLLHELKVELRNHLDRPVRIEVRERVPVATEVVEDLVVEDLGASPDWEEWPTEDGGPEGGRRWVVELTARSERSLSARYEVRIPDKHELHGGNRRES